MSVAQAAVLVPGCMQLPQAGMCCSCQVLSPIQAYMHVDYIHLAVISSCTIAVYEIL